jgi:hypothetical protein
MVGSARTILDRSPLPGEVLGVPGAHPRPGLTVGEFSLVSNLDRLWRRLKPAQGRLPTAHASGCRCFARFAGLGTRRLCYLLRLCGESLPGVHPRKSAVGYPTAQRGRQALRFLPFRNCCPESAVPSLMTSQRRGTVGFAPVTYQKGGPRCVPS